MGKNSGENLNFVVPQYYPDYVGKVEPLVKKLKLKTQTTRLKLHGTDEPRPFFLTMERQRLLEQIQMERSLWSKEPSRHLAIKSRQLDLLSSQLMEKRSVSVDMGELGTQQAKYVVLDANPKQEKSGLPIILLPGVSNDAECVGWFAIKLSLEQNRTVIVCGYPEGWDGDVTQEFGNAVRNSPDFGPHVEFFQKQIDSILPDQKYELWAYSTGCPIAAKVASSENVDKVVMVAPAGCNNLFLPLSLAQEATGMLSEWKNFPYLSPINPRLVSISPEKRSRMLNTFEPLSQKAMSRTNWWVGMNHLDKDITVVSYKHDHMTRSIKRSREMERESIKVIKLNGGHNRPLMQPDETIQKIFALRA